MVNLPVALKTLMSILEIFKSYELSDSEIVITVDDSELCFETPNNIKLSREDEFSLAYYYGVSWCDKKKAFKRYIGEVQEINIQQATNGTKLLKKVLDDIKDMTPGEYLKLLDKASKRRNPNETKRDKTTS